MKLSDFKNEEAVELLADIIEPLGEILADAELREAFKLKVKLTKFAKIILKRHRSEVIEILAALEHKTVDEFECNVITLPKMLLDVLNDEMLLDFFGSQPKTAHEASFGTATEPTQADEQ